MPSFDVISKVNHQEFDNALSNCLREISNRFDFKGLHISIDRKDKLITTIAPDELKLRQVNELLQTHLIRRKVDPVSYTHLRAPETVLDVVSRLLLEKK